MYHKNAIEAVACDDKIEEGWFRFDMITGNDMPVTCHFEGDCGTDNPIWLNGSLPSADDGIINGTVCVKNATVCCAKTYDIQIKNCSTYNVYHLPPVSQCSERYCIGDKALCPPGTLSEDGFEPGCSDNFPNITLQPDIQVDERVERYIFGNKPKKELMFTCLPFYDQVPADKLSLLFFDVKWYIDSQLVHEEDNVDVADLPAQLRESVWLGKSITLGFQVKCSVKGKYVQNGELIGARSLAVESPEFFAGIKVLNSSDFPIRMKENDPNPAIIAFQPTVPVLCTDIPVFGIYCEDIFLQVEVRIPQQWKQALCPSEGGVSQRQEAVVEACGIQINAKHWNKTVTLKIAPVIDGIYDGDQITKVLLSTADFQSHKAWSNYRLPDIPILVVDTDMTLKGLVCMANSDPHMMTFDGVRYECQLPGEFIMYKHRTLPIQVHGFFKKCNNGRAFCPCAVTVMSGGDLFIFDRCRAGTGSETTKGIKRPMRSGLLGCEHGQMRVESFNNAKDFKIYLPTGGYVYARSYYYIDDYYMNIHIHPGSRDVESTLGLCGTLNGNKNDDFLRRDGTTDPISLYPNDFSLSWRVSDTSDSMYNGIPASSNVTSIQAEYCRCPAIPVPVVGHILFNSTLPLDCSYTENVAKCASDNSYSVKQLAKCRKRRAAAGHDEIFEIREFEYNPDDRIEAPTWQNGWTEAKAEEFCSNYIYNSSVGKACQAVENVDYEVALKGCKDDIHLTGGTAWALAALDSIKGMCVAELSKNESYWVVDNSTGEVALPEELDVIQCPNDCSSNGVCTRNNGTSTCECYPGYVSSDCSISRDTIPDLYYMPTNGLCDISQRPCLETPVYGGPFVQSSNLSCKTEHLTASGVITEYNEAEFINEEEVICPFPKSRLKRSDISSDEVIKVYNISVSNDGTNYSQPLKVAMYDSNCYKCDGPIQCQLKNGTCSINGKCYNNEEQNPSDACQICNPNVTTSDWYLRPSTCTIDNQCYTDGQERTGSFCHVCSSDKNRNSWDIKHGTCSINSSCYNETQQNPAKPCQICDPRVSNTEWTQLSEICEIEGICIGSLESRRDHVCHICSPSTSRTSWTIKNGTCSINGSCYNESQQNPARPCQICDPRVSNTEWTQLSERCEIEGSCIGNLESRDGHMCHICSPNISTTSWTIKNGTCSINGSCYNETQQNPARSCQICDPRVSNTEWTQLNGTCSISGSCYYETQQNPARPCEICDPRVSNTEWTELNGTCSINGICYNETQQNPARPCQICDPRISQTVWIILNNTCLIDGVCYNTCQVNPVDNTTVCHSSTTAYNWTSADACDQMDDIGSTVEAPSGLDASSQMAIILGGILGSISIVAVTLIVVVKLSKRKREIYVWNPPSHPD
ncbi:von Willebrand factor D and EGF domain-containing protein isoform X3 [Lingula anatina]|uniref:von Willebrand factor D and EGF domain-containing protein isoform X3 n=1 Tax=Lingula anatina TaxID=7574 RepID=A0A2R2MJZ3_LINAN|nr:von Willebrand factor D and EGF domain-containing protein isoform X3 [Lingula anatina]|eukprot:XP_023930523.1 von Willebrand factor D and EGF domain-containing protein isoform X3 [Lingula anatina]